MTRKTPRLVPDPVDGSFEDSLPVRLHHQQGLWLVASGFAGLAAAFLAADVRGDMSGRAGGQSLVEFALMAPVLLILLLLTLDVGRLFSDWVQVTNAAREGAYVASLAYSGDTATQTVVDAVTGESPSMGLQASQISVAYSSTGDLVMVQVNRPFQPLAPFVRSVLGSALSVSAQADFPVRLRPTVAPTVPPSTATPTPVPPTSTPTSTPSPPTATPTATAVPPT